MSLQKGFIRNQPATNPHRLGVGIILGINLAVILYAFFDHLREAFRLLAGLFEYNVLIELTVSEQFYYKWFFAAIATVMGLQTTLTYYFRNTIPNQAHHRKWKRKQRHVLADIGFVHWTFLHLVGKLFIIFGIAMMNFALQFHVSLLKDFPLLLVLIPVVLFLQQWPIVLKMYGRRGLKLKCGAAVVVILLSLAMTQLSFFDQVAVDRSARKSDPVLAYDIRLPAIEVAIENYQLFQSQQMYLAMADSGKSVKLYWPENSLFYKEGMEIGEGALTPESFVRLDRLLNLELVNTRYRYHSVINLFADGRIQLGTIRRLYPVLKKNGIRYIQFSTGVSHSSYPAHYPRFRYVGLRTRLGFYYPEATAFLDSLEQLDPGEYAIQNTPSNTFRVGHEKGLNRVDVRLTSEGIYLNGKLVSEAFLQDFTKQFIQRYAPDQLILFHAEDDVLLGDYLNCLDKMRIAVMQLRREQYMEWTGHPLDQLDSYLPELDSLSKLYPLKFIEWTPEEHRLLAWMKKSEERR